VRCRAYDILPPHIFNLKIGVTLQDINQNKRLKNLKSKFQYKLLNLEIKEIHSQINFFKRKIEKIENILYNKIPKVIIDNFISSNDNRFSNYSSNIKVRLVDKFNKIRPTQNSIVEDFNKIDRSKWLVNLSSVDIPETVSNILCVCELRGKICVTYQFKRQEGKIGHDSKFC